MSLGSKELVLFFLGEINKMRVHPKTFLKHMEDRLGRFQAADPKIYARGDILNLQYKTIEGQEAVNQAHDYLLNREEGKPLELSYQLSQAAFVVGGRMARDGEGKDMRSYQKDLLAELDNNKCRCEQMDVIVEYGFRKDRELVPSIVIDDGNELKNRRDALMNDKYQFIGLAVHEHREFDYQLLILLADDVKQVGQELPALNCEGCTVM